jgi:hypothetical protein
MSAPATQRARSRQVPSCANMWRASSIRAGNVRGEVDNLLATKIG